MHGPSILINDDLRIKQWLWTVMRRIEVQLKKDVFEPGEIIDGRLIVICNSAFEFNDIHVTLMGVEHTRIEESDGEDTYTYTSKVEHVADRIAVKVDGHL